MRPGREIRLNDGTILRQLEGHDDYYISARGYVYKLTDGFFEKIVPDNSSRHSRVYVDGEKISIAREVLKTFGEPLDVDENTMQAFHIDGDPFNNRIDNLLWLTHSEVQLYSRYSIDYRLRNLRGGRRCN